MRGDVRNRLREQLGDASAVPVIDEASNFIAAQDVEEALAELKGNFESVDSALPDPTTFLNQDGSVDNGGDQDWGGYDLSDVGDLGVTTINGKPIDIPVVDFTATGTFTHRHALGFEPCCSVIDSNGHEVVVCVEHLDTNTVRISFSGTLTGASLLYE